MSDVHGTCRWRIKPFSVPACEVGVLEIKDSDYLVTLHRDAAGVLQGARLLKTDGETQYHVEFTHFSCDCADHQYRKRPCKHARALCAALGLPPLPETE